MQLVDTALARAAERGEPVRLGLVGAGYSGRLVAHHILHDVPGIRLVAIGNRTARHALDAFRSGGIGDAVETSGKTDLEAALSRGRRVVSEDIASLCASDYLDVIVDLTGTIEFGAELALQAIEGRKHLVSMNVELDSTVGPLLNRMARDEGVVYSNIDGDEPGVAMNLVRTVRGIGLEPVVAGNLKGLYDPYRNPATQEEFARAHGQKPTTMTHFADGTKLSMELTVLANGTGFCVARRGCFGPSLPNVKDTAFFFLDKLVEGGMVDYVVGAEPKNGVFVLARVGSGPKEDYLEYFKMGSGPLYCFNTPYHLPHLELANTVARAALFDDATVAPLGPPVCDTVAVAKKNLWVGETLDGIGGYCAYGLIENYPVSLAEGLLPMAVSEGCRVTRDVAKDTALTYADVELPPGRTVDRLREAQKAAFEGTVA
jgi:predicted homoserine dehydrogenase-like protein